MKRPYAGALTGPLVAGLANDVASALSDAERAEGLSPGTLGLTGPSLDRLAVWTAAKGTSPDQLVTVLGLVLRGRIGPGGLRRTAGCVQRAVQRWQQRPIDGQYAQVVLTVAAATSPVAELSSRPVAMAVGTGDQMPDELLGLWAASPAHDPYLWRTVLIDVRRRGRDCSSVCLAA